MKGNFLYGMGVGMAVGAAMDRMMQPDHKKKHHGSAKALKAMGTVVESVADVIAR